MNILSLDGLDYTCLFILIMYSHNININIRFSYFVFPTALARSFCGSVYTIVLCVCEYVSKLYINYLYFIWREYKLILIKRIYCMLSQDKEYARH